MVLEDVTEMYAIHISWSFELELMGLQRPRRG
jgi:hypothetical protein